MRYKEIEFTAAMLVPLDMWEDDPRPERWVQASLTYGCMHQDFSTGMDGVVSVRDYDDGEAE
ncbi:hypothetical protein LHJ74_30810 [Streptomyces sp. N2-109]|uniref:Uncharacterized protein n=1 Tax=Streptomyces gossypii TaxID=2883101 RepID=A0ABT2K266_9ACTN|nr:hypothetical protein [Streptomyces gossypii]MCT2594248.1 hypothetical protein [Streptomyces gossypii]